MYYKQLEVSNYIDEFEKIVSIFEIHYEIQLRNSAIYENYKKSTTVYIRINGDCKQWNTEKVIRRSDIKKYIILLWYQKFSWTDSCLGFINQGRRSYHLDLAAAQYVTSTYKLVSGGVLPSQD
jgi:hypothetical protein